MRIQGLLLVLVASCAADEPATGEIDSEANVYQWLDDVQIPNQTSSYQVGLAPYGTRLYMVHTVGGSTSMQSSRFSGSSWSSPVAIANQYADYGPALAVHAGQLTLVYHASGQNRLLMSRSSDGSTWTSPVTAGASIGSGTIRYAPAATTYGGDLFVGYCLHTSDVDHVRIDRFDGTSWTVSADWKLNDVYTCKQVAMAVLADGTFEVLWNATSSMTGDTGYVVEAHGYGAPRSSWYHDGLTFRSKKPDSMVSCGGITHMVHGGNANQDEIWWTVREAGAWIGDARVPDQASSGGAALGCFGGSRTIMVHNGGYSQLWWSEYGP